MADEPCLLNSDANIKLFGSRVEFAVTQSRTQEVLAPREQSFFWALQGRSQHELVSDCYSMFQRGTLFYRNVSENLANLSRIWAAVIDVKDHYESTGAFPHDPDFMRSFLLCTALLADRGNWGHDRSEVHWYQSVIQSCTNPQSVPPYHIPGDPMLQPLLNFRASFPLTAVTRQGPDADVEAFALSPAQTDCGAVTRAQNDIRNIQESHPSPKERGNERAQETPEHLGEAS